MSGEHDIYADVASSPNNDVSLYPDESIYDETVPNQDQGSSEQAPGTAPQSGLATIDTSFRDDTQDFSIHPENPMRSPYEKAAMNQAQVQMGQMGQMGQMTQAGQTVPMSSTAAQRTALIDDSSQIKHEVG